MGKNMLNIEREPRLDPRVTPAWEVRESMKRAEVPAMEGWRIKFLGKLLEAREEMNAKCENIEEITLLINSLCSS